jgi:hypothetical protein
MDLGQVFLKTKLCLDPSICGMWMGIREKLNSLRRKTLKAKIELKVKVPYRYVGGLFVVVLQHIQVFIPLLVMLVVDMKSMNPGSIHDLGLVISLWMKYNRALELTT